MLARMGHGGMEETAEGIKTFKLPVIRLLSLEHIMYSVVTIINNIVYLKVAKRVDLKILITRKKILTM